MLEAYARFWETLRPETTGNLRELAAPDLLFRDPFNEIRGVERVIAMLDHMFASVGDPDFVVRRIAQDRDIAFLRWDFTCTVRQRTLEIEGVSEVRLAEDGRVAVHIDYWDPAARVYARIPLLGSVLKGIRKRLAAPV